MALAKQKTKAVSEIKTIGYKPSEKNNAFILSLRKTLGIKSKPNLVDILLSAIREKDYERLESWLKDMPVN
jgi:hypothetical protein